MSNYPGFNKVKLSTIVLWPQDRSGRIHPYQMYAVAVFLVLKTRTSVSIVTDLILLPSLPTSQSQRSSLANEKILSFGNAATLP